MKPLNALRLYRVRLRARWAQECLAVVGIAAGVALLFASQVSSSSLQSSVAELARGIDGNATLQLLARDPHGFPERMLGRVRRIPGVRFAAPLLEAGANATGPRGGQSVELVGADASLSELRGTLVRHTQNLSPFANLGAVVLPAPLAQSIGVTAFGREVTFQIAGRTAQAPLYSVLDQRQIGSLIASPVALVPLSFAQETTGFGARVSRILVQPAPGAQARVRAALRTLAAGRLNVEGVDYETTLFATAAAASNKSTELFAVISALVGFLFAFNATLLTVPQRRRLIVDLRRDGYAPRTVIGVLLIDALALGLIACVLGLALGDELSIHLFHSNPAFLSLAFALGSQRVVGWQSVALALAGGMLAAIVAVLTPLRDILAHDPLAAGAPRGGGDAGAPRSPASSAARPAAHAGGRSWAACRRAARAGANSPVARPAACALAGALCLGAATAILLADPAASIPGMVLLMGALLLALPLALDATLALVRRLAGMVVSPVPHVATMELSAARARAVAIAATGAVAVFGSVAIQGAHRDLLVGLENAAREMNAFTDVWVSPAGSYDLLKTTPFAPTQQAALKRLPGVRAVGLYRSGLLDYGERRVLVIAPPREATPLLPAGQLLQGDPRVASERVRRGGWLVLSAALASEHHLRIGDTFTLPSPDPRSFRVAALSTNVGWAPGAIVMNATDYAHAWGSSDASAYSVVLAPGVSPARGAREIERALGLGGRGGTDTPGAGTRGSPPPGGEPAGRTPPPGGEPAPGTPPPGGEPAPGTPPPGGEPAPGTPPRGGGLAVETAAQHAERQQALSRAALARLTQIATLIPIAAVLAMAAAMGAMVWQRRPRLAKLKLEGLPRVQLWQTILLESLLLLGAGCLTGALFGLYGQQLADRALASVVNFPVVYSVTLPAALRSLALVSATALAILALPGYLAASVPAALALQD